MRSEDELASLGITPGERTEVEVFVRVMGYIRPKISANIGKQGEFAERVYYKESMLATSPHLSHDADE